MRSKPLTRCIAMSALLLTVMVATNCTSTQREGLVGSWTDASRHVAPDGTKEFDGQLTIRTFLASPSCGVGPKAVYLELAWPPVRVVNVETQKQADTRFFVRDTSGRISDARGPFDPNVEPPSGSTLESFQREGNQVVFESDGMPYVHRPDGRTERWPEVELNCA
jgi:hypothetical protein